MNPAVSFRFLTAAASRLQPHTAHSLSRLEILRYLGSRALCSLSLSLSLSLCVCSLGAHPRARGGRRGGARTARALTRQSMVLTMINCESCWRRAAPSRPARAPGPISTNPLTTMLRSGCRGAIMSLVLGSRVCDLRNGSCESHTNPCPHLTRVISGLQECACAPASEVSLVNRVPKTRVHLSCDFMGCIDSNRVRG